MGTSLSDILFYFLLGITFMYFIQYGRMLFKISRFAQSRGITNIQLTKLFVESPEMKEELKKEVVKLRTYKIMFYVFLGISILFRVLVFFAERYNWLG
ncbi:MAG: hypothetical protein ACJATA_000325 [Sphingobacteriales bacterium]|jgi:hypothetical protein